MRCGWAVFLAHCASYEQPNARLDQKHHVQMGHILEHTLCQTSHCVFQVAAAAVNPRARKVGVNPH